MKLKKAGPKLPLIRRDIDGVWNRILTLDRIRIHGKSHDTDIKEWVVSGEHLVLEIRDAYSGIGWDDKAKPRHQYVLFFGQVYSRCLPPENTGDVWRNEQTPPVFTRCLDLDLKKPNKRILQLLSEMRSGCSRQ